MVAMERHLSARAHAVQQERNGNNNEKCDLERKINLFSICSLGRAQQIRSGRRATRCDRHAINRNKSCARRVRHKPNVRCALYGIIRRTKTKTIFCFYCRSTLSAAAAPTTMTATTTIMTMIDGRSCCRFLFFILHRRHRHRHQTDRQQRCSLCVTNQFIVMYHFV